MKNKLSWLAGPYVLWMTLVVIVPILLVVVYAFTASGETAADIGGFTLDNFSRMGTYTVIFARSFQLALVATLVCLLIGYPLAYVMAKEGPGFQRVAMVIIMLPMWVNFLLRTYAWMAILENNGILNNFFEAIGLFDLINGLFGTDISFFPMIRTQGAVVLGMELPALHGAAHLLGHHQAGPLPGGGRPGSGRQLGGGVPPGDPSPVPAGGAVRGDHGVRPLGVPPSPSPG